MDSNFINLLNNNNIVFCTGKKSSGKTVFMFPGHGAQYVNMMRELSSAYKVVQNIFDRADSIYLKLENKKLTDCFISSGDADRECVSKLLSHPRVMQPAIFCCNMAMYYLLESEGFSADCFIGHSLGELSALCAAKVFDFETGLQIAYQRGCCSELIPESERGFMLSVNSDYSIELEKTLLGGMNDCCVSIVNSAKHFNISGSREHIEIIKQRCEEKGIHSVILNVTHAFHSDYMIPAVGPYCDGISGFKFSLPVTPVYSTILERRYEPNDFVDNQMSKILSKQLVQPFNFRDIIRELVRENYTTFVEVGPSNMLGKLVRETVEQVCVLETNNRKRDDIEVYELYKAYCRLNQADRNHDEINNATDWVAVQNMISRITMYPKSVIVPSDEPFYSALAITDDIFTAISDGLKQLVPELNITKDTSLNNIYRAVSEQYSSNNNNVLSDIKAYLFEKYAIESNQISGDMSLNELCDIIGSNSKCFESEVKETETLHDIAHEPSVVGKKECGDIKTIKEIIRKFICEKTGYPVEFLEDDLDFEADLGIDSVKQSEIFANILSEYGIQAQQSLKEYNTIAKVAEFVNSCGCGISSAEESKDTSTSETEIKADATENRCTLVSDINKIHEEIISIISEKTGYPKEILEDDLDFEADLGIDSVKQADIFAKISEECGYVIGADENIKAYNTIAKITAFISEIVSEDASCTESEKKKSEHVKNNVHIPQLMPESKRTNRRCVTESVPVEFDPENGRPYSFNKKNVLLIADTIDGALTDVLCRKLIAIGAQPIVIMEGSAVDETADHFVVCYTDERALEDVLQKILAKYGDIHCVINLAAVGEKKMLSEYSDEEWETRTIGCYNTLLFSARAVYGFFEKNKTDTAYFTVTNIGDCLGYETASDKLNVIGAISAGFLKGMERELRPFNCKMVDLTECSDIEKNADIILQEFSCIEQAVEICYDAAGIRMRPYIIEQPLTEKEKIVPLAIDKDDVIFVTGGSRGIVHEFIISLLESFDPTIVFTGRTPLPDENEEWVKMSEEEFAKYKSAYMIFEKQKNPKITIREVDSRYQRMANARKLMQTLSEWKKNGHRVEYMVCDAGSISDLTNTLQSVIKKYGKISGIINGAGLPALGLVPNKIVDFSQEVVRVKANSFFALTRVCSDQNLKFFYSIGSISGRFGMDGQTDYSAGADLIVRMTCAERRRKTCCKYAVLGWSAWADTGMAMHEGVRKVQQEERGLEYISIEEGRSRFIEEVLFGGQFSETLFFGKLGTNVPLGQLDHYDCEEKKMRSLTTDQGYVLERSAYPLIDRITAVTSSRINAIRTVNTIKDLHLLDHKVENDCVFAGVMHIEACCELIQLFLESNKIEYDCFLPQIDSFSFKKFIKVYHDRDVTLRLSAEVIKQSIEEIQFKVSIVSDFVNRKGIVLQKDQEHSEGTITVQLKNKGTILQEERDLITEVEHAKPFDLNHYYKKAESYIFFGNTFRYVRSAGVAADQNYIGTVEVPDDSIYFSGSTYSKSAISPVSLDNIGRFMLFHEFEQDHASVVPIAMDGIVIHRYPLEGEIVTVKSERISTDEKTAVFSLKSVDSSGKLIIEMRHVVLAKINTYDID